MTIDTQTIPQEFFDITSGMLLRAPEPQYLYSIFLMSALASELQVPSELGLSIGDRAIAGQGADYGSADADRLSLSDPISQELFDAKIDFNGAPGTQMKFNRPTYTDSLYTKQSRLLNSMSSVSTTAMSVTSQQTTLTLERIGGPHNGTNVAPLSVDKFSARLGVHNLVKIAKRHLIRDFWKTTDALVRDTIDSAGAANVVYPDGMTADNDATTKTAYPLDYETISRASKNMDDANLPTLADGRRVLVVTPAGYNQLKQDPAFQRYSEFHKEINPLFTGSYMRTLPEFHVFKSTTLTKSSNTSGVKVHYGHAIAPGALGAGMADVPRVVPNSNDQYGEEAIVIWRMYLALGALDSSFIYSVRHSEGL